MILAAGRGERLRPLTDSCPKPLLKVQGKALIEYHIEALARVGIKEIVINLAYLSEQFQIALGSGKKWGVDIQYSLEDPVLETGGGIFKALPLLGEDPFMVLSSDIFTDFPFESLVQHTLSEAILAHLILIDNAEYPRNFGLRDHQLINTPEYTYGNIGIYRPELFKECKPGVFPLGSLLKSATYQGLVTGEAYEGAWINIGTAEQLQRAQMELLSF